MLTYSSLFRIRTYLLRFSGSVSLEQLNTRKVDACLALAERAFNQSFPYQNIRYDLRGKAAGQLVMSRRAFRRTKPEFRFNKAMLERYGQEFIDQVVPHECAHLVAFSVYGTQIKPHGREWKSVMREVYGLEPAVTHQFEVQSARDIKRYSYACACEGKEHALSSIRHNKVVKGTANYLCKSCQQLLVLKHELPVD